jgi:hypothetical protein
MFINKTDLNENIIDFFKTDEELTTFLNNINNNIEILKSDNKYKFIEMFKSIKNKKTNNIEQINELKILIKEMETILEFENQGFEKIKIENQFYFTGFENTLTYRDIFNIEEIEDLNEEEKEIIKKYTTQIDKPNEIISYKDSLILLKNKKIQKYIREKKKLKKYKTNLNDVNIFKKDEKKILIKNTEDFDKNYGSSFKHFNEMRKLQEIKNQKIVDDVILKINSNVSEEFLDYITPNDMQDNTDIPDVNLIFEFKLPSGKMFNFILKKAKETTFDIEKLIKEMNPDNYDRGDIIIINRIFDAHLTGQLNKIIKEERKEKPKITSKEYREEIDDKYSKINDKLIRIGLENKGERTVFDKEYTDYELMKIISEYQTSIKTSKNVERLKEIYLIEEGEEKVILSKMKEMIKGIKERSPKKEEELKDLYKLSLEHIMLDAIQGFKAETDKNRKGRYYRRKESNGEERFLTGEKIKESILEDEEKDEIVLEYYDVEENKVKERKFTSLKKYEQFIDILNKKTIEQIKNKLSILPIKYQTEIKKLLETIADSKKAKQEKAKKVKEIFANPDLTQEEKMIEKDKIIKSQENNLRKAIAEVIEIFRTNAENGRILITNINNIKLLNQKKYIYTISVNEKGEKEIYAYLEGFDPTVSGRPAHSELAEGRPVITAGEILVEKENKQVTSQKEFIEYLETEYGTKKYEVTEINNGSGHYRPKADSLKKGYEEFKKIGITTKLLRNSLQRMYSIQSNLYILNTTNSKKYDKIKRQKKLEEIKEVKQKKKKIKNISQI